MALGNFEIQILVGTGPISIYNTLNWAAFERVASNATSERFVDGSGNTLVLRGTFNSTTGEVGSATLFHLGAKVANLTITPLLAVGSVTAAYNLGDTATHEVGHRLKGGASGDIFSGYDFDDVLNGNAGADKLWGKLGNDILNGGADNDYLNGGLGNDTVKGGTGHDIIVSGEGKDKLWGGAAADAFIIDLSAASAGTTTINDFEKGSDILVLHLDALPGGAQHATLFDLAGGTSLADADASVLAALGMTVTETAAGGTMITVGDSRLVITGVAPSQYNPRELQVDKVTEQQTIAHLINDLGFPF